MLLDKVPPRLIYSHWRMNLLSYRWLSLRASLRSEFYVSHLPSYAPAFFRETFMNSIIYLVGLVVVVLFVLSLLGLR